MEEALVKKIDAFFTQFKYQKYKKGEILIRADDDPTGIFYLKKGTVKEYAISKKGDEVVVNIFKPASFFPMSWAINNTYNRYYFEATSDVEIWKTPREKAVEYIKNEPDVLFNLLSRLYKGTDGLLTRMTYLMSGNAYARLIAELLIYAKRFGNGQNVVDVQIAEKDLAAQSGMTRETVSREMKILKDKGLVVVRKNILAITDLEKLEDELTDGA